ncbi:MAG: RpiB/LacA/LacB family sugar-phosphate isomerase [Bdellovibrionaceae bacterium]|nr:RpiB/LacA/LacB family sugar-phosphate isomerase [Pseudobdellovibrionaceae bacterium]NUM58192.1 RpiB/LacA/LacB family sugar-phosphate isomerase [Pseudobdellovibrionaceae bacterium]
MIKNLFIGSDHGGFDLKLQLLNLINEVTCSTSSFVKQHPQYENNTTENEFLSLSEWKPIDLGCFSLDSVNYTDIAEKVCKNLIEENTKETNLNNLQAVSTIDCLQLPSLGLLICGSGQGMAMKANKYSGIRAALVWNETISALSREHNNANILCLPGRFMDQTTAFKCLLKFLNTPFAQGRHSDRVKKIN